MNNAISNNVQSIEISGIRKFFNKVEKYPSAISLTLGQPDFKVPQRVKEAMIKAIIDGKTTYTPNAGIIELRLEISKYLKNMNICYSPKEVCVTVGGSEGLLSVFTALINTGDKVLIPTPAYPAYESCVKLVGGQVVNYNLNSEFGIDFHELKIILDRVKPKIFVLSFPSNPTGAVLSQIDKNKLINVFKERDIIIVSDEIYSALYFNESYNSIAQCEALLSKVILVSGFSKMFSMTGLRIGYVCAKEEYMKHIMKVHQYSVSCAPSIGQWGALEGLLSCNEDVEFMKIEFEKRRDFLYEKLIELGFECKLPKGAFYIFPSIKNFGMSSEEFCERLLSEAGVAIVPGTAFGVGGEDFIRISYSYSMAQLEDAINRMGNWIRHLK
ncbi:MAG: aminotransferase class I/II-fold pyridoxal phosphate-dependent enzyme [Clostridiaceae bacterium]|nr:aminotransferase class I/II-fold pyridoxal phosphate-dependent enzyme [Clostridiaceae bacterium]